MTVSIKNYLSGAGTTLEIIAPAPVIRAAFQANLITRADVLNSWKKDIKGDPS
jgi:hypothetical protein